MIGKTLNHYRIVAELGRGGMGQVASRALIAEVRADLARQRKSLAADGLATP